MATRNLVMMSVYLDPEDHAALKALSKTTRVPMNEFIRQWVRKGLYGAVGDDWTARRIRDALARAALYDSGEAD